MALDHFSKQAASRKLASNIVEGTLVLSSCLENGLPCEGLLSLFKPLREVDYVVSSVMKTLPAEVIRDGVPTFGELSNKFKDVKNETMVLTLLPNEGGGLLAQVVARLGSLLKVG